MSFFQGNSTQIGFKRISKQLVHALMNLLHLVQTMDNGSLSHMADCYMACKSMAQASCRHIWWRHKPQYGAHVEYVACTTLASALHLPIPCLLSMSKLQARHQAALLAHGLQPPQAAYCLQEDRGSLLSRFHLQGTIGRAKDRPVRAH